MNCKMNCNDCCYNLPKDGYSYCTYEEGECVKMIDNDYLIRQLNKAKELIKQLLSYEQIPRNCLREQYRKLLEEAEQFLRS